MSTSRENAQTGPWPSHLLVELTSLDDLSFPTSSSKRVKFTCICASARSLVFGTSSGSVYVFSRFRQKSRSMNTMPKVEVFTTKDAAVNTVTVSPCEQMVAVGSDSGRVSIASLPTSGGQTKIEYTVAGDPRGSDKTTCLIWSPDSRFLFSGHKNGAVRLHKFGARSGFRSTQDFLCSVEEEIVQIDFNGERLLISTTHGSFVYDLEEKRLTQVGNKTRNSRMGACFVRIGSENETATEFIAASRPNGRMWEANEVGVVYRTHQFRQSQCVPRCSYVSFREDFRGLQTNMENSGLETAVNMDVNLGLLHRISSENDSYLLTYYGSTIGILDSMDPDMSRVVLLSDLQEEIIDLSVYGSDIFLLLNGGAGSVVIRKLSLLTPMKTVEKLQLRKSFVQAAQVILSYNSNEYEIQWRDEILRATDDGLRSFSPSRKGDRKYELLKRNLSHLIALRGSECTDGSSSRQSIMSADVSTDATPIASPLHGGIHRVHTKNESSGYGDDIVFRLPQALKERSRSSPSVEIRRPTTLSKHGSMPLTSEEIDAYSRHGTPDVTQQDILERAKNILESDGHVVERDSLKTLLQLDKSITLDSVKFAPTVTINNAAKALADLALKTPLDVSSMFEEQTKEEDKSSKKSGPLIIKPVRRKTVVRTISKETKNEESTEKDKMPPSIEEKNEDYTDKVDTDKTLTTVVREKEEVQWLEDRLQMLNLKVREPPPLSSPSPVEKLKTNTLYCPDCNLHRSWLMLSVASSVVKRLARKSETSSPGAVPSNSQEWSDLLFQSIKSTKNDSIGCEKCGLCPRCEAGMAISSKHIASLPSSSGLSPLKVPKNGMISETIRSRLANGNEERLKTILFGRKGKNLARISNGLSSNLNKNGQEEHSTTEPASEFASNGFKELNFIWLDHIRFEAMMFLCCVSVGFSEFLSILSLNKEIKSMLSSEHWSFLTKLAIRDQQIRKNSVDSKALEDFLRSQDLDKFFTLDYGKSASPVIGKRLQSVAIFSWIVDANGNCPVCTLALQAIVKGAELTITSFNCGHNYHTVCLNGRSFCVACRARARKLAGTPKTPTFPRK